MKKEQTKKLVEAIGNGLAMLLGLAFLGELFDLWSFNLFDGWWVLFLYIPAICGFLTRGITAGGIFLTLTAIVLTVGIFMDIDGRIWGIALILYLAYLGASSIVKQFTSQKKDMTEGENENEL